METIHSAVHSFLLVLVLLFHIFGIFDPDVIADGLTDDMIPASKGASVVSPTLNGQRDCEGDNASFFSARFGGVDDITDVRLHESVLNEVEENPILFVIIFSFHFAFKLEPTFMNILVNHFDHDVPAHRKAKILEVVIHGVFIVDLNSWGSTPRAFGTQ